MTNFSPTAKPVSNERTPATKNAYVHSGLTAMVSHSQARPWWSVLLVIFLSNLAMVEADASYTSDCSANARLRCIVEKGCTNTSILSESIAYPSAPFDLRISPYLISTPVKKPNSYQLRVNISWKPTYEKSIFDTKGFELTILDKDTNNRHCFSFKLNQPDWKEEDRHSSIRFSFSTIDLFEYDHRYYIEVVSLPKAAGTNSIAREIIMPKHPEQFLLEQLNRTGYFDHLSTEDENAARLCSIASSTGGNEIVQAHPFASQWITAFRYIYIQPKANFISVEFVAAPPQYCFEEYELRLLKDLHYIIDQVNIRKKDLHTEIHGNVSVSFGRHTFHNVTPGIYEIGVLPVDRSEINSRCLCPSLGQICACSQAVWPDVVMPEPPPIPGPPPDPCSQLPLEKLPLDCPMYMNGSKTIIVDGPMVDTHSTSLSSSIIALTCLLIGALIALIIGVIVLQFIYKCFKKRGVLRLYILPVTSTTSFNLKKHSINANGGDGLIGTEMTQILHPVKVLIIYTRDSPIHENTVRSFADYLSSQCVCDIRIDYLCTDRIDENKFDWAYQSIAEADRVLLVNSFGAYVRYQAKLMNNIDISENSSVAQSSASITIERADQSPFDDLFLLQLDLISQYRRRDPNSISKFVSIRFAYTPAHFALPHANPYVHYEVPRHLSQLMVNLHQLPPCGTTFIDDEAYSDAVQSIPIKLRHVCGGMYDQSIEGQQLKICIETMKKFTEENPDWFECLHVRRPIPIHLPSISSPKTVNSIETEHKSRCLINEGMDALSPLLLLPQASSQSAIDSGYDESEILNQENVSQSSADSQSTSNETDMEIPENRTFGIDQNEPLLPVKREPAVALESHDSGISTDLPNLVITHSNEEKVRYSPEKAKRRYLNNVGKGEKEDVVELDMERLIC